ncbi:MAG: hypothetical protein CMJ83_21080 [Planctomycetes bacterium]|nr:hypothetical protein [Planctomycetota bacterium]
MGRRSDHRPSNPAGVLPEARGAFGGFIGPRNLLTLVDGTAPWLRDDSGRLGPVPDPAPADARLSDLADDPLGWWHILRAGDRLAAAEEPTEEAWTDYFALCVAAHFGTVATYVPTDVDTKIRDRLWYVDRSESERDRLKDLSLATAGWNIRGVSRRVVDVPDHGPVSGHDGERLSILAGGILGLLRAKDESGAEVLIETVDQELHREARAFDALVARPGRERDLLVAAAALTHNAGDVDQGLSARKGQPFSSTPVKRFGRLAHERFDRYGGAFARAARLYKDIMASDGHRHYPLRDVRALRTHPDLLLPVGPFFDDWGRTCATSPHLSEDGRAEIVAALVNGVRRVKGQVGYDRALAGFDDAHPGGLASSDLVGRVPASTRRALKDKDLRRRIAVRQASFESAMAKRARRLL